jgi:hypothetical protein
LPTRSHNPMHNALPLLIVAVGAVLVFGTLVVLVGKSIIDDWRR